MGWNLQSVPLRLMSDYNYLPDRGNTGLSPANPVRSRDPVSVVDVAGTFPKPAEWGTKTLGHGQRHSKLHHTNGTMRYFTFREYSA